MLIPGEDRCRGFGITKWQSDRDGPTLEIAIHAEFSGRKKEFETRYTS